MRSEFPFLLTFIWSLLLAQPAPVMAGSHADLIGSTERYEFHSNAWLNLHHYLYNLAKDHRGSALADHLRASGLSSAEVEVFENAAAYYRDNLIDKSLLFDRTMFDLKRALIKIDAGEGIELAAHPELESHLRSAKPIYESILWPEHHRANQQVLERNLEQITRLEGSMFERIAELAQFGWPAQKIRVDLTYVANWAGGYTTVEPVVHAVIRSRGWESDLEWLEILFHEPTHALIHPDYGTVADTIERVSMRMNTKPPRNLWHGILFYLSGTALQEVLAAEGIEYELFMFRHGVFGRLHETLKRHMPAYVAGETTLEATIENMLAGQGRSLRNQ